MDEIKIDRCFVTGIQNSAYNYRLLNNILELAGGNQVRTCCEGVETIEELNVLNGLHCSLMQGYLFSPPCPAAEFERRFIAAGPDALPHSLHLSGMLIDDTRSLIRLNGYCRRIQPQGPRS